MTIAMILIAYSQDEDSPLYTIALSIFNYVFTGNNANSRGNANIYYRNLSYNVNIHME